MPIHNATSRPFYASQPFVKFPSRLRGQTVGEWEVWGRVGGVVMAHKLWKQSRRSIYFVAEKCPQHFSSSAADWLSLSLSLSPLLSLSLQLSCCPFLTLLLLCFVNVVPQKQLKAVPRHFTSFDDGDDISHPSLFLSPSLYLCLLLAINFIYLWRWFGQLVFFLSLCLRALINVLQIAGDIWRAAKRPVSRQHFL